MIDRNAASFMRTLRLKVRPESYAWLNGASVEVNQVFNFANETSLKAATRTDTRRKWMSGFDLCNLTAGATEYFEKIGADTIQRICTEYASKRKAARCRTDALHKFSRKMVDQYQNIVVGDVSSLKLVQTRMAKSVLDSFAGTSLLPSRVPTSWQPNRRRETGTETAQVAA